MKNHDFNNLEFKKISLQYEVENKTELKNILKTIKLSQIKKETQKNLNYKIFQNCNKIYSDIEHFSEKASIKESFDIIAHPRSGNEKKVENLINSWKKCTRNLKDLKNNKEEIIKYTQFLNNSYFLECKDQCINKISANEIKDCLNDCYRYHKINTIVAADLIFDQYLKFLNDLKLF